MTAAGQRTKYSRLKDQMKKLYMKVAVARTAVAAVPRPFPFTFARRTLRNGKKRKSM